MIRRHCSLALAAAVVLLASCTSNVSDPVAASPGGPRPSGDGGARATIDKKDLGGKCGFGCEPGVVCGGKSSDCPAGYCVFEGRSELEPGAYCSAACDDAECPLGYTCETVSHSARKLCVAKQGRCGDGDVQGQELCDDGNDEDFDACNFGCSVGQAVSRSKLSFGVREHEVDVKIDGELPLEGDASGCGVISLAHVPNNRLFLQVVACNEDASERVTWSATFENRVGRAKVRLADIEARFKLPGQATIEAIPSCTTDCGISIDVMSAWSPASALKIGIEGSYRKSSDSEHAFSTLRFRGTVRIGTDEPAAD